MLFAYITGSKIKKHVGGSIRGGVRPIGGGYDPHPSGSGRNPRHWAVHPPSYFPLCVSYISNQPCVDTLHKGKREIIVT